MRCHSPINTFPMILHYLRFRVQQVACGFERQEHDADGGED